MSFEQLNRRYIELKLIITRHPQTEWNEKKITQGQLDIPINDNGFGQALKAVPELRRYPIEVIVSSDLQRCRQLAIITALWMRVSRIVYSTAFRERNMGEWQGRNRAESLALGGFDSYAEFINNPDVRPRNGESRNEVIQRVKQGIDIIRRLPYDCVLLVTHGFAGRCCEFVLNPELTEENFCHWKKIPNAGFVVYDL